MVHQFIIMNFKTMHRWIREAVLLQKPLPVIIIGILLDAMNNIRLYARPQLARELKSQTILMPIIDVMKDGIILKMKC